MKAVIYLCSFWLAAVGVASSAENHATPFYVQLIRGTEEAKPRDASWKPVGAKVNQKLTSAFRPRSYWEVNRLTLDLVPGQHVKAPLSAERTVEIQLFDSGEAETRIYFRGKLLRKCRQATHDKICIMGGTRETDELWFVAVSRVKPD